MDAQALKILRDLQYRIEVSDDNDPEKANAIRVRDRLLAKYGLSLEDIVDVAKKRKFGFYNRDEVQIVIQYMRERLHLKNDAFDVYAYRPKRGQCYWVEAWLDDAAYSCNLRIVEELMYMYRHRRMAYKKKLEAQMKKQMEAWRYVFLQEADLLSQPTEEDLKKHKSPSWGLSDAIKAAKDLEDIIFPQHFVEQKQKELTCGG